MAAMILLHIWDLIDWIERPGRANMYLQKEKENKTMWAEGSIKVENSIFHYWVKHFEEPSEDYGIDGGRISKLMLKRNGKITYNYDRGLDIEPIDKETEMALAILMTEYN